MKLRELYLTLDYCGDVFDNIVNFMLSQCESLQQLKVELQYSHNNEILPVLLYKMPNLLHLELTVHEFLFDHELLNKPSKIPVTLTLRAIHLDLEGPHYLPINYIHLAKIAKLKKITLRNFNLNPAAYNLMRQISGLDAIIFNECKFETFERVRNIKSFAFDNMSLNSTPLIVMENPQLSKIKFSALMRNLPYVNVFLKKNQHIKHFDFFTVKESEAIEFFQKAIKQINEEGRHLESLTISKKIATGLEYPIYSQLLVLEKIIDVRYID